MNDDSDLDLMGLLRRVAPQGPGAEDDTSLIATGVVQSVDVARRRVTVKVRGGVVTLPAPAARYQLGGLVRVIMDATARRPVHVLGAVDVRDPAVLAKLTAGPTSNIATVALDGKSYSIPALPGAYTIGESAWVHLNDWGVPVLAAGPSSAPPPPSSGAGGGTSSGSVVAASTTINPQQTGTYRASYGRWDTWGTDIGGGVADIYQGNAYGSGPLYGLACYGDQIANLGALSISRMLLTVRRNSSGTGSVALTVQGAPHGTRPAGAPSSSGETASSGAASTGQTVTLELPASVREAFRTGAAKGLAAVGGAYAGFGGTTTPGSFALLVEYTRNA